MQCIRELNPFFVCFHFFGQTAYIPSKVKCMKRLLIRSIFIKLIYFAVALAFLVFKMEMAIEMWKTKTFSKYMMRYQGIHMFIVTNLLLYKSIASPYLSRQICEQFSRVIDSIQLYLRIQLQMNNFKRSFLQKILSYLSVLLLRCTLHLLFKLNDQIFLYVLPTAHIFAVFQVILFVDLINFSLNSINTKLEEYLRFKQPYARVIILFRYVKWIHFSLWEISEILNKNFGLVLIIMTIHYFIWIVLPIYYVFVYSHIGELVISK